MEQQRPLEQEKDEFLLIDESWRPAISNHEARELKSIQKQFMESYLVQKDSMPVDIWLQTEMGKHLPGYSAEEVTGMSREIITTLKVQEEKKASLEAAVKQGRSKESWFASESKKAVSFMGAQEAAKYLQNLDSAMASANDSLLQTIHTQAGVISQNPNLDGFIAEQYHAQTFNLNAKAAGSQYWAEVLEPDGSAYKKNSVDIVIKDGNGRIVKRYQSKYGKSPEATQKAFEQGNYRGQGSLVPADQASEITRKSTPVLEAPDGTKSNPLSKVRAKEMQAEAQSGNWNELNWNEYQMKDLAAGIGKQAGQAALMGAVVGVGLDVAQKVWSGEEIKGEELVETALVSGADFGVKAAAAGALKVASEKGIIAVIPKGTPAATITNIVYVAVENIKIASKMAMGQFTTKEGLEKMEQTTVATIAGIAASTKGTMIGAAVGMTFGPVGAVIGGFIGGTVGYMAGSKAGEVMVKGIRKVREAVKDNFQRVSQVVSGAVSSIRDRISLGVRGLLW